MNRQEEIETHFFEHVPEEFCGAALKSVFQAHKTALDECRKAFADTETENVVGYNRRGKLEGYLRDAVERFPELTATVERADNSNWNHTEVRGGPVIITENSVQTPCALVDKAEFRLTWARRSQLSFWEEDRPDDAPLYALLLHSRSQWLDAEERKKWSHLPGSAFLAFPSPNLEDYVHRINLFKRYPKIVQSHMPKEWDVEAQVRYLRQAQVRSA